MSDFIPGTIAGVMLANRDVEFSFRWDKPSRLVVTGVFPESGDRPAVKMETWIRGLDIVEDDADGLIVESMNRLVDTVRGATAILNDGA